MTIFWLAGLPYLALGIVALMLLRPYIVCRRRCPARPAGPETADHRWRKIGASG